MNSGDELAEELYWERIESEIVPCTAIYSSEEAKIEYERRQKTVKEYASLLLKRCHGEVLTFDENERLTELEIRFKSKDSMPIKG